MISEKTTWLVSRLLRSWAERNGVAGRAVDELLGSLAEIPGNKSFVDSMKAVRRIMKGSMSDNIGLYNTGVEMWRVARKSYKERGIFLVVCDGHVVAGSDGIVARFPDDESAVRTLTEAGFKREGELQNIIFKP